MIAGFGLLAKASGALAQDASQQLKLADLSSIGIYFRSCLYRNGLETGTGGRDVTLRFSLSADGALIGAPRITHLDVDERLRPKFLAALQLALKACLPVPLNPGFGATIAGRPLTIRVFIQSKKELNI